MLRARALVLLALLAAPPLAVATLAPAAEHFLQAQALRSEGNLSAAAAELDRALALAPDDGILHLEKARVLFELGRLDEASVEAAAARRAAPRETEALRIQGRIELGRAAAAPSAVPTALEVYTELRRREPDDIEVLVALGQLHLASRQAELAVEALGEAIRLRPGNSWLESLRARAVAGLANSAEAERIQSEALRRDPDNLSARLELAERLGRAGRHAEAVSLLEATPASQSGRPEVIERLARQLHFAGASERARPLAERALAERPQSESARRILGQILVALGYFAEAEGVLVKLQSEAIGDELVAELLVRALEAQGKVERAAEILSDRRDAFEREGEARLAAGASFDLARLLYRQGRFEDAAVSARAAAASGDREIARAALDYEARSLSQAGHSERALALAASADKSSTLALDLLLANGREQEAAREAERLLSSGEGMELRVGAVLHERERWAAAAPLLERALAADPTSIEAKFRLAACSERLGSFARAVELFRELVARAPQFAAALNYLGYLWIERTENLDEAVRLVSEAVRLEPDSGAYVDSLGWGLFRLGRIEESVRALERAARLQPNDATIHEHLGDARAAGGDRVGAGESYRRALELSRGVSERARESGRDSERALARKLAELSGES